MSEEQIRALNTAENSDMREHTKEPWLHDGTVVFLSNNSGGFDLRFCPDAQANARRIVACVNACASFSTEMLEKHGADTFNQVPTDDDRVRELESLVDCLLEADMTAQLNGGGAHARHTMPAILELRKFRAKHRAIASMSGE